MSYINYIARDVYKHAPINASEHSGYIKTIWITLNPVRTITEELIIAEQHGGNILVDRPISAIHSSCYQSKKYTESPPEDFIETKISRKSGV